MKKKSKGQTFQVIWNLEVQELSVAQYKASLLSQGEMSDTLLKDCGPLSGGHLITKNLVETPSQILHRR